MIYFDNAATTKPLSIALDTFLKISQSNYANPSSLHIFGKKAKESIEENKQLIKNFFNINKGEVIFTASATLSNNIALIGSINYLKSKIRNRKINIIYSETDHPSLVEPIKKQSDIQMNSIDYNELYKKIDENCDIENYIYSLYCEKIEKSEPDLLILQWVNGENGLIIPVEKIAEFAKRKYKNIIIHVDAVQGFLKLPLFNFKNIDSVSFSAHKFGGLKGTSILYIKEIDNIRPIFFGGGQMKDIFPSTENVAGIASTVSVINFLNNTIDLRLDNSFNLKNLLIHLISQTSILKECLYIFSDNLNNQKINFSPYIIKIYNTKLPSAVLQNILSDNNIMVSIASACSSNKKNLQKDNVFWGIPAQISDKGIRISFFIEETPNQIEELCKILSQQIEKYKAFKF